MARRRLTAGRGTTVWVGEDTLEKLRALKGARETYDQLIRRLIRHYRREAVGL